MYERITHILAAPPVGADDGKAIGTSRHSRPVRAFQFGTGSQRVSLLGGCHADEPVGPRLLRHLSAYLSSLPNDDPMLTEYQWWIVPHINPDGEDRNRGWQRTDAKEYDLVEYLMHVVRELPGDDIEFGFPRDEADAEARPENRAAYEWWNKSAGPFHVHVSLHGMAFAAGPWFLIESAWKDRCKLLKERCASVVRALGYVLHDVERHGEKGFFRLERGFCTRPDSRYMREHFETLGDHDTAQLFRPSSMESILSLGGDTLTLLSEMPLFITPGVGDSLGPPDPQAEEWKKRIDRWKTDLASGRRAEEVKADAAARGLRAMPVRDQMALQWTFITAGLEQVRQEPV